MSPAANNLVRWRPEPGAVLGFHKGLARTVLVSVSDLEQRLAKGARACLPRPFESVIGLALASDRDALAEALLRARTTWAPPRSFAVPETLHFEVAGACPLDCPSCYLERGAAAALPWERLRQTLQEAIDMGVLQVAFGGGEPLGYEPLEEAVALAARHGLGVSITTSGLGADTAKLSRLRAAGLDHLQVSVPEQPSSRDARLGDAPWAALAAARAVGLSTGANVVAASPALTELPAIAAMALRGGARSFNLLRPKPVARDRQSWFERNRLRGEDWRRLAVAVARIRSKMPEIRLTLDSALSPIIGLLAPHHRPRPTAGCAAGRRFAAVDRNGRFKPCSHLQGAEEESSLAEYWKASPALAALRSLEETIDPGCRECPDLESCRGCRAIAGGETADSDCWRGC
ncbi:MAG: radical SAM protein [Deltaproteobacteria bacterium]|nr:radical SAM protein [Deltaproteobacteria bacterium]